MCGGMRLVLGSAAVFFTGVFQVPLASAESFLGASKQHHRAASLRATSEELQAALGAVLSCGEGSDADGWGADQVATVREALWPVWRTLPKDEHGRVEWQLLRYLAHRHFIHRFGVLVRGLEPTLQANATDVGKVAVLSLQVPNLAQQVFGADRSEEHGFSLEDAAAVVAALERLLFDSERALMEQVYEGRGHGPQEMLTRDQLTAVLTDYMFFWFFGEDEEGARELLRLSAAEIEESIPHWAAVRSMVSGSVMAADFAKRGALHPGDARGIFSGRRSFEDALIVAGSIGRRFSAFWDAQCQATKDSLLEMDPTATGRVKLSDFYGSNQGGEWRFAESESYLRGLGALDESSPQRGKEVLIANYLQGASNCVATRPHYLVCCRNECEAIQAEIEDAFGTPVAEVDDVIELVGNMTDMSEESTRLDATLKQQLHSIAQKHSGKLPLHGRLFAQWLHYVFPRECAFPHKTGSAAALTPSQFGDGYLVTEDEMNKHVHDQVVRNDLMGLSAMPNVSLETSQWMTQWSEDEELLADYSKELSNLHDRNVAFVCGCVGTVAVVLLWLGTGTATLVTTEDKTDAVKIHHI